MRHSALATLLVVLALASASPALANAPRAQPAASKSADPSEVTLVAHGRFVHEWVSAFYGFRESHQTDQVTRPIASGTARSIPFVVFRNSLALVYVDVPSDHPINVPAGWYEVTAPAGASTFVGPYHRYATQEQVRIGSETEKHFEITFHTFHPLTVEDMLEQVKRQLDAELILPISAK